MLGTAMVQFIQSFWVIPIVIVLLICYFVWSFWQKYWHPAKGLAGALKTATEKVKTIAHESEATQLKVLLGEHFDKTAFAHAWQMYEDTLHDQYETVDGEQKLLRSRATVSSEYFFTQSLLVDTPLNIEFFKHLPGLMTGVGIVGTFAGLLMGLLQFDPAGDPSKVQNSLDLLLHGVSEAFIASGFAILMAMVVTGLEKSWLRKCYAQLEELTTSIDKAFDADDVGEAYLNRILDSAKDSATQTKQLKDSLVNDLKAMMENLAAENQKSQLALASQLSEAYSKTGAEMAADIGRSITETLQSPLEKIASSVQQVSGDQGSAVQGLLTDVLSAFMAKLESTFGKQMTGMSDMMAQSVNAMRDMQHGFSQLIADMRNSSEASSKALEEQMVHMLSEIQLKQNEMGNNLNRMLETLQENVAQIGTVGAEAAQKMGVQVSDMLHVMNDKINSMMTDFSQQRADQDRTLLQNQQVLHEATTGLLDNLGGNINQLLEESRLSIQSTRQNIETLTQVSTSCIAGMNEGAEKMRLAAERFNTAGQSLSSITEKSSGLIAEVNTLFNNMNNASTQLRTLITDYQQSRESVNQAITTLERLIEVANKETGMTSQMLNDMQHMTTALKDLRQDMQQYLNQVNDVLVKSFVSFGDAVESSLTRSLGAFDNTLEQAVKRLHGSVDALSEVAEDLGDLAQRAKNN
jgi:putative membrane protein